MNTVGSRRGGDGADYLITFNDLLLWATRQGVLDESCAAPLRASAQAEPDKAASALTRAKICANACGG